MRGYGAGQLQITKGGTGDFLGLNPRTGQWEPMHVVYGEAGFEETVAPQTYYFASDGPLPPGAVRFTFDPGGGTLLDTALEIGVPAGLAAIGSMAIAGVAGGAEAAAATSTEASAAAGATAPSAGSVSAATAAGGAEAAAASGIEQVVVSGSRSLLPEIVAGAAAAASAIAAPGAGGGGPPTPEGTPRVEVTAKAEPVATLEGLMPAAIPLTLSEFLNSNLTETGHGQFEQLDPPPVQAQPSPLNRFLSSALVATALHIPVRAWARNVR